MRLRPIRAKQVLAAILLLAAGAGMAGVTGGNTSAVRVVLPAQASVVGPRVTLGEIAQVSGADRALVTRLERLEIGAAAPAGQSLTWTPAVIRIAARRAGLKAGFELGGAETVEVTTRSQPFDTAGLTEAIRNLVVAGTGEDPTNVEVTLGTGQKIQVPAGTLTSRVKPPASGRFEGSQLYTVEVMVDGRLVKRQPLRAQVRIRRPAVVTLQRIERGSKIVESLVALKKVDSSQVSGDALTDLASVLGRTAGRMLEPGRVIRVSDLSDPPLVKRNGNVSAFVKRNNVELAVDAKALEDGKAGQVIRIQNAASGRIFKARVLDEKTVEVVEPPKK